MADNTASIAAVTARAAAFATDQALRFPATALEIARLSIYDYLAVAVAGSQEPVSMAVRELVLSENGSPHASAFGIAKKVPARAAALLNGAAAHALDYDDTHFDFVGHPSAAVLPAVLAIAEQRQASGAALIEAFLVGVETTCRLGAWLGRPHYNAGFHQTATSGAFGATAGASRLLGLDAEQASHAMGLAATRAAGLKCQFGTMAKPFHAGMAASTGVESATLAALGFIARPDAIECAGGFAATHGASQDCLDDPFAGLPGAFRFVEVQYKFHACCHGTHAALEALRELCEDYRLRPLDIEHVTLTIAPQWLQVCCIPRPKTGLEAKFSLSLTAAMVLAGVDTASLASFSDACCQDLALTSLARRVEIRFDQAIPDTACLATVLSRSGATLSRHVDLSAPVPYDIKTAKLRAKAEALLGAEHAQALWGLVESIGDLPAQTLYQNLHSWMAGNAAMQR